MDQHMTVISGYYVKSGLIYVSYTIYSNTLAGCSLLASGQDLICSISLGKDSDGAK